MSKEEHVSVPRAELETLFREFAGMLGLTHPAVKRLSNAILSRATPSPHEVIRKMESELPADIYGREPSAPRVVTDSDVDIAIDAAHRADTYPGFVGYRKVAMRAALESFLPLWSAEKKE